MQSALGGLRNQTESDMTRNLAKIAKTACQTGAWLFAASDAYDEGREVIYFDARARQLRTAAHLAERMAAEARAAICA
jgi:hypothetical protein